jgi:hypothetical protein
VGEVEAIGFEVGAGVEGDGFEVAGFEGGEADEVLTRRGVDVEHVVDASGKRGGAAEETGFVGVVDDDDGGAAIVGDFAEVVEDGLHGQDGVFV